MVPDRVALARIFAELPAGTLPIVIDPVVRTSKGEPLSSLVPRDFLRLGASRQKRLVLTPNRDELRWLGVDPAQLLAQGFWAVVVKGSETGIDEVFSGQGHHVLEGGALPRNTSDHRGTGCRFASGLATHLGRGDALISAARGAKRLVRKFLREPIIG